MKTYAFRGLMQSDGWLNDPLVTVDDKGCILSITSEGSRDQAHLIDGFALPGFQNAHSHAFQYAMAGLAEKHGPGVTGDDFWSWRETMYQLALSVGPDQMEWIASMLYCEMVRYGYTHVAEFHYLHHDKNGKPYNNLAEMGDRLVSAAKTAGINITLIPIFYQKGGFGMEPGERQRRFITSSCDDYFKLYESTMKACQPYEFANIGIGIHSMRAVDPHDIIRVAQDGPQDVPFHIHLSEQIREVEDCMANLGKRPIAWILENVELNDRFHFVHATHTTPEEVDGMAKNNVNVVLCPSTEGNLGDGFFALDSFQRSGGKWSIGTDSHVGLNPLEELRILDYGQRLVTHKRKTFTAKASTDSSFFAIEMALNTGRKAMNNQSTAFFEVGDPLNALIIDAKHPLLSNSTGDAILSTIIYTVDPANFLGTIVNGQLVVEQGKHMANEEVFGNFIITMSQLKIR